MFSNALVSECPAKSSIWRTVSVDEGLHSCPETTSDFSVHQHNGLKLKHAKNGLSQFQEKPKKFTSCSVTPQLKPLERYGSVDNFQTGKLTSRNFEEQYHSIDCFSDSNIIDPSNSNGKKQSDSICLFVIKIFRISFLTTYLSTIY